MQNKKYFCGLVCLAMSFSTQGQIITTFAGNGMTAVSGDGGPATAAAVHIPWGITVRGSNVFIAGGNRVRIINSAGIINNYAGGGTDVSDGIPATAADLVGGNGLTIDRYGNMYLAISGISKVRKISPSGIITTVAGNGTLGYSGDGGPATAAQLTSPADVATDTMGNLYIGEQYAIRKVTPSGIITTIAGNGTMGYSGDGGPATAAQLAGSGFITIDIAGNIYFADMNNYRIRKIDTAGIITTVAGNGTLGYSGDGGPATAAMISLVRGIEINAAGELFIGDASNHRVRKINTLGIISTVAGTGVSGFSGDGGPALAAEISGPCTIAFDDSANLYFCDGDYRRVRKITSTNHGPYFTGVDIHSISTCFAESIGIDSMLAAMDADTGQYVRWGLAGGPMHGTVTIGYGAVTAGMPLATTGIAYHPTAGFAGTDTFRIRVTDGYRSDTTMICVTILPNPDAGIFPNEDTTCTGNVYTFSGITAGGVWSGSSGVASVSAGGVVTALSAGIATISYTVTNSCGTATATHTLVVYSCPAGIDMPESSPGISIAPNPGRGDITFYLSSPQNEDALIIITDLTGREIKRLTTATNRATKLMLDAVPGIYLLTAATASGTPYVGKVVVE